MSYNQLQICSNCFLQIKQKENLCLICNCKEKITLSKKIDQYSENAARFGYLTRLGIEEDIERNGNITYAAEVAVPTESIKTLAMFVIGSAISGIIGDIAVKSFKKILKLISARTKDKSMLEEIEKEPKKFFKYVLEYHQENLILDSNIFKNVDNESTKNDLKRYIKSQSLILSSENKPSHQDFEKIAILIKKIFIDT